MTLTTVKVSDTIMMAAAQDIHDDHYHFFQLARANICQSNHSFEAKRIVDWQPLPAFGFFYFHFQTCNQRQLIDS
jgi:hypothetical protein